MLGTGLGEALLMLLPFAFVATIVGLVLRRRTDRLRLQADVRKEIIGRFGSTAELREFLKSEEGQSLMKPIGSRPERSAREQAIRRIGLGIIFVIVGGGLSVLAHYADQPQILTANPVPLPGVPPGTALPAAPLGPLLEVPPGTGLPAAVLLLVGIGLIVSSVFILLALPRDSSLHPGDPQS